VQPTHALVRVAAVPGKVPEATPCDTECCALTSGGDVVVSQPQLLHALECHEGGSARIPDLAARHVQRRDDSMAG
jgi:hypothetical protein